MRWFLVFALLVVASTAHAEGSRFAMFGLGTSMAEAEPGFVIRAEHRLDTTRTSDGDTELLTGARVGLEMWDAGGHWGFAMPIGFYAGGQVEQLRTTIGGGVGLWTFERSSNDVHFGVAPFASASLEGSIGKLAISLDGRLARQVVMETADFNVYSVMLMVGRRFAR